MLIDINPSGITGGKETALSGKLAGIFVKPLARKE
jgi:hypothetical protein